MKRHDPIEITERELTTMTADLDEMHHDAMPKVYESVAEWAELHHSNPAGELDGRDRSVGP